LYYIQDPSAMLPAEMLDPKPGEWVLDLCAAPGGKTVQLAAMMKNTGFLLANDISPKRVKPLRRNLENIGVANAIVTYESPEFLSTKFGEKFDKVLVDAPCSGEGMFRKDTSARTAWNRHDPKEVQQLQRDIIRSAWKMVKPGGIMVYSTCTFNPDENEYNIIWALQQYSDMRVTETNVPSMELQSGRTDWVNDDESISCAKRIWPHLTNAEGHFAVCLLKSEDIDTKTQKPMGQQYRTIEKKPPVNHKEEDQTSLNMNDAEHMKRVKNPAVIASSEAVTSKLESGVLHEALKVWRSFVQNGLHDSAYIIGSNEKIIHFSEFSMHGNALYVRPDSMVRNQISTGQIEKELVQNRVFEYLENGYANGSQCMNTLAEINLEKLRIEMPGLCLGELTNGRFEPASSLLHAMNPEAAKNQWNLDNEKDADLVRRYLHGETLMHVGEKGWLAILVDGYPLGWAKQEDGFIKNKYPKNWRMQ